MDWPADVFKISFNNHLIFFPTKIEGQFYFVPVMTTSENECQQYNIEIVVHERQMEAGFPGPGLCARFQGSPLSIDAEKKDQKLYGTNEALMTRIMSKWIHKNSFSLSFKLGRTDNI